MSAHTEKLGLPRRRRNKWIGFVIAEVLAAGVLALAGTFAISLKPADPALSMLINIVIVAAAAAAALIPIFCFAIAPVLPRGN
jgi:hypothetical protein